MITEHIYMYMQFADFSQYTWEQRRVDLIQIQNAKYLVCKQWVILPELYYHNVINFLLWVQVYVLFCHDYAPQYYGIAKEQMNLPQSANETRFILELTVTLRILSLLRRNKYCNAFIGNRTFENKTSQGQILFLTQEHINNVNNIN